jgi:hypothetical protein
MSTTKVCGGCRVEKPTGEFHRHKGMRDGLHRLCKECRAIDHAKGYERHAPDRQAAREARSVEKVCARCGETFFVFPAHVNSYSYCSMECRRQAPVERLSRDDLGYLAGIFDGEGSVIINLGTTRHRGEGHAPAYQLQVTISNTHRGLMEWIHASLGGSLTAHKFDRALVCHNWKMTDARAGEFLELLLPFLRVKREQAEVGIAFRAHIEQFKRENRRTRTLDQQEIATREGFRLRLRELKGKWAPRAVAEVGDGGAVIFRDGDPRGRSSEA